MQRTITNIRIENDQPLVMLDCLHEIDLSFIDAGNNANIGGVVDCPLCPKLVMPEGLECYKRTGLFDHDSVPKGFLRKHATKSGVWAKIIVTQGRLRYIVDDLGQQCFELDSQTHGVIAPQMKHHVALEASGKFYVEFYRAAQQSLIAS